MQLVRSLTVGLLALSQIGCSKPQAILTSNGTFKIEKSVTLFDSEDDITALAKDFEAAAIQLCSGKSKRIELIGYSFRTQIPFAQKGSAVIEFKCVLPEQPK